MMTTRQRLSRQAAIVLVQIGSLACCVAGDQIKIADNWYDNVTIVSVQEGKMVYVLQTGKQIKHKLDRVMGIKMGAYPQLAGAQDAMDRNDLKTAARHFASVRRKVKEKWLINWIDYRRMQLGDRLSDPVAALSALMQLARNDGDAFYLKDLPMTAISKANLATVRDLERRLALALRRTKQDSTAAEAISSMRAQLRLVEQRRQTPNSGGATAAVAYKHPAKLARSAIALTRALSLTDPDDPVTQHLRTGEFTAALKMVDRNLKTSPQTMARRLYQRGMAKLAMADRSGDEDAYKNAGLDFMRVVIYYPKSTSYVGACLLEAGYVHLKIARADIAATLFGHAGSYIGESEPELSARLETLKRELVKSK